MLHQGRWAPVYFCQFRVVRAGIPRIHEMFENLFISKGAAVCARHLYSGRSQWRSWSGRAGKLQCLHHRSELSDVFVRTIHYWYIYDDFLWIFMSPSSPILFQIMAHTVCGEPYWLGERLLSAPGPSGADLLNFNFSILLNFHEVFFHTWIVID